MIVENKSWPDFWCVAHRHLDSEWSCMYTRDFKEDPTQLNKAGLFVASCRVDIVFDEKKEETVDQSNYVSNDS